MSLWIVTGLSGAGKATALAGLEKADLVCVDNLPVALLAALAEQTGDGDAVAVIDARQGDALALLDGKVFGAEVLFLDARDDVLMQRLGNSTMPHPFETLGRGLAAIAAERTVLAPLRIAADVVIDTSDLAPRELQQRVRDLVQAESPGSRGVHVMVSSFGYKHGPQLEADWVVDARMIRNPFWETRLRGLTGLDAAVRDFVLAEPVANELVRRLSELLQWSASRYAEHGRRYLHVAVGCTGGRHRSVVVSEELAASLRDDGFEVAVRHRDVLRADPRE